MSVLILKLTLIGNWANIAKSNNCHLIQHFLLIRLQESFPTKNLLEKKKSRSRTLFYFLIILSLVTALLFSILAGLVILIASVAYFSYLNRLAKKSVNPSQVLEAQPFAVQKETIIQREVLKVPCKYCNALLDPFQDKTCPKCGAPVTV